MSCLNFECRKPRRSWLLPAIVAFITFIGGVASNLVASDLEGILPSYRIVVWGIFGLSLIITVVVSISEARNNSQQKKNEETNKNPDNSRTITVDGNINRSTIITGDNNIADSEYK